MNKYHGKVLRFNESMSTDEKKILQNALPKRSDFLDPKEVADLRQDIKDRKKLFFLPNDMVEQHYKESYDYEDYNGVLQTREKLVFKLVLLGVMQDGNKAAVIINNIDVFFDLRVPQGADPKYFETEIRQLLKDNKIYPSGIDHVMLKPFKLFSEDKQNYLRIHFNTLFQRRKAINLIRWKPFDPERPWQKTITIEYTMKNGKMARLNDNGNPKVETANDDLSCYYRKAAREYKFLLAGWNLIDKYTIIRDNKYAKRYSVPYQFEIDVNNIKNALTQVNLQSPEYKHLLKDKSMMGGWDLETFAPVSTGGAPEPGKVFDANGNDDDVIFLDSVPFMWYWDTNELVRIAITEMPAPPRDDCLIIQCDHQTEIIKIKALIMERMAPEFLVGFNDGSYDWPFVLRRCEEYDAKKGTHLMEFMRKHMSVIPYDENQKFNIKGRQDEKFKLEAGQYYEHETFNVPGFITIDVRGLFMQMFPKSEKSNLNFFLAKNKLGSKEYMPYQTMFKIYRLLRHIRKVVGSSEWNDLWQYAKDLYTKHGPKFVPFSDLSITASDLDSIDDSSYNIDKLTCEDIIHLLGGEESGGPSNMGATQVVHYCNVDARRCCDLLRVRNVVADRREVGNLSYTSMYDALYRANGMKVRNLVMAYACTPEWNIACPNISSGVKDERKYPGAYVVSPTKGLGRDHKIVKRKRRALKRSQQYIATGMESASNESVIDLGSVSPDDVKFESDLLNNKHAIMRVAINNFLDVGLSSLNDRTPKDEDDQNDRPVTGLDFSSLYPSLIMAYNLSPEKAVLDKKRMLRLQAKGYQFLPVKFLYGLKDQEDDQKEIIEAWIVQHTHPARGMIQEAVSKARVLAKNNNTHWSKYVDQSVIKRAWDMYKKTSLDDWREFNMGLYPFILKDLFNRRSEIKKVMGRYAEPQEFLSNVYKVKKLEKIATMSIDD